MEYFSIYPGQRIDAKGERACSEGCVKVIAKDIISDWVYENKYKEYFNLDKLDDQLNDLLENTI
ncbi:hypothetical protein [Psychrobacillus vulpis]|uniref:Uncharacterized protein n=1 Tax=Psychrobacillus vulpis TaxID=2325572 RepID=A0A544TQJ0_9BACI|nr:hypothetical protein [Psychrobacillus vulpis]TQR19713.1 hypothetical protein FG384_10870 [Psychrobacillus vulpis]